MNIFLKIITGGLGAVAFGLASAYFFSWPLAVLALIVLGVIFWRWPEKSFFALLAYLPFQLFFNPLPGVDLASGRVLILILFFVSLLKFGPKSFFGNFFKKNPAGLALVAFFCAAGLALLPAENFAWAGRKFLFLASVLPIFFLAAFFSSGKEALKKFALTAVCSASMAALIALVQFLAQFAFGSEALVSFWSKNIAKLFYGESFGQLVTANPSWLVDAGGRTLVRAFGLFPDPHMLAFFLGMALPLCAALIIIEKKRWIFAGLFGLIALTLALTFSRGGYLGITLALAFFIVFGWRRFETKARTFFVSLAFLFLAIFLIFGSPVFSRFLSSFDASEGSAQGRLIIWQQSLTLFEQSPVMGVGLGNYSSALNFGESYRNSVTAHNLYLDLLVEGGVFLLFFWLAFLAIIFKQGKALLQDGGPKSFLVLGGLSGVVYFIGHSFFETAMFNPANFAFFLALAGVICSSQARSTH